MRRKSEGAKLTITWLQKVPSGTIKSFPEGYQLSELLAEEYFKSGERAIASAETAGAAEQADNLLSSEYIGDSQNGFGLRWVISEETYSSWIEFD
jgi:hypothetical protein